LSSLSTLRNIVDKIFDGRKLFFLLLNPNGSLLSFRVIVGLKKAIRHPTMSESEEPIGTASRTRRTASKSTVSSLLAGNFGKLPPQAVDLEEAVLGALMLEKNALTSVIDILHPDSFYKDTHKIIFKAIRRLFDKTQPIDILTVTNELKLSGELDIVGGPFFITQLTNRVAS